MGEKWEELVEQALQDLREESHQKETVKVEDEVFDDPTMRTLSRLISHGHIDTLDHCLSTGKEANVFRGTTPEGAHVAVKVYRVHTSSFRSHQEYIWGDPRFKSGKPSKREMVTMWATKEFKNLSRFLDAGCRVPTPITVRDNVIVMEFIGEEGLGAPLLKGVELEDAEHEFEVLFDFVKTAWTQGRLVHGDLSEWNVLALPTELVVIDCAQSVVQDHPRAPELLRRDLGNLVRYFKKHGVQRDPAKLEQEVYDHAEQAAEEEAAAKAADKAAKAEAEAAAELEADAEDDGEVDGEDPAQAANGGEV